MEPSAVSHQLRLLRHLGLVTGHRDGRRVVYDLYDDHVGELLEQAISHVGARARRARPQRGPRPRGDGVTPPATAEHAGHRHAHGHGHSHGLVDPSITRSRAGLRVVLLSLAVLAATAAAQAAIYVATGSVALLADLDPQRRRRADRRAARRGVPAALQPRRARRRVSRRARRSSSAPCIAGVFAIERLVHPLAPDHLLALALAGVVGAAGNAVAARVRLGGGRRLDSPALIADG